MRRCEINPDLSLRRALYNRAEVDLIVDLCSDLTKILRPESVGIITPYRKQKSEIQRSLQNRWSRDYLDFYLHTLTSRCTLWDLIEIWFLVLFTHQANDLYVVSQCKFWNEKDCKSPNNGCPFLLKMVVSVSDLLFKIAGWSAQVVNQPRVPQQISSRLNIGGDSCWEASFFIGTSTYLF